MIALVSVGILRILRLDGDSEDVFALVHLFPFLFHRDLGRGLEELIQGQIVRLNSKHHIKPCTPNSTGACPTHHPLLNEHPFSTCVFS